MRTFDPAIILELAKETFKFFILVELELSTTVRYVNADVDLYIGGYKYQSADFTFDKIDTSGTMSVDTVSLSFNNADLVMSAVVLSEDILGKRSRISFICIDDYRDGDPFMLDEVGAIITDEDGEEIEEDKIEWFDIIASEYLFYGFLSDWDIDEGRVIIETKTELILWRKETLRTCQSSCRWPFKGDECGYSGVEIWCDQSYERCDVLNNSDNFGGFRFLPDIMEKDIWWGRIAATESKSPGGGGTWGDRLR